MNHNLQVESELSLKPNCGKVSQLTWLTNSTLLATSHEGIQTWQCDGDSSKPCLLLGMSIGLVTAEACPDQSTLAAGSRDGVVSCIVTSVVFASHRKLNTAGFCDLDAALHNSLEMVTK